MGAGTVGGGNRRGRSRFSRQPMSEINVTPFVDVMLVLLIIFMVAAPLLTTGVDVDLPKTKAKEIQGPKDPLVLTIAKNGDIFIQDKKDQPLKPDQVVAKLNAITKSNKELPLYLKGDKEVVYDKVAKLMGVLSAEGYSKISLITGQ